MRFGYHNASFEYLDEDKPVFDSVRERAKFVESHGFEWFSFMDHLWQIPPAGEVDEGFFECYTSLSAVAAATDRIRLGALVTCVHYRNPAFLGYIMNTLDHVSQGRATFGIGAGWYEDEYEAYGYDFPDASTRIQQMEDAVKLIKKMWTQDSPVTYEGDYYKIEDLILEPKPLQDPHPPILVGGGGEKLTLRATAELADMWNLFATNPEGYSHKIDVLTHHCEDVGRDCEEIEKSLLSTLVIRDTTEEAHDAYEELKKKTGTGPAPRGEYRGVIGSPEDVIEQIGEFQDVGVDLFIIDPPKNDWETLQRFVDEVMPEFS